MATLDQIYRAYLNEDPNVSKMVYDPHGWNYRQTFDDTTDEDTTDTLPVAGGITNAYAGGVGDGVGMGYVPDYGNPYYMEDDEADPFFMQREDPSLLKRFGIGAKNFLRGITGAFPNMINRAIGRPPDATYSYPGDVTGYGSRAGITQEELRNMELLEQMGGIDERGQDIYGINVVSGFGDYTAYNEKRVEELEVIVASQKKRGLKDTIQMKELEDRTGLQTGIESDEEAMTAMIKKKEDEARRIRKGLKDKKDILGITPTVAGTAAMEDIISAPTVLGTAAMEDINIAPAAVHHGDVAHGPGGRFDQPSGQGGGGYWGGVTDVAEMGSFAKGGRVKYGKGGIVDLL